MNDHRVDRLRQLMEAAGNPADGLIQRKYHKSEQVFYGLKAHQVRAIVGDVFPTRIEHSRAEHLPIVRQLWASDCFDEQAAALLLLARIVKHLGFNDLKELHRMAGDCTGWALLDSLACTVLGPLAMQLGDPVYREVRVWSDDPWMWTRRASILVHVIPARRAQLIDRFSWSTFDERLSEKEFFIRKAIGWALRECCKHYPIRVFDFLNRVGDRASGLTRKEGSRRLPDDLQMRLI